MPDVKRFDFYRFDLQTPENVQLTGMGIDEVLTRGVENVLPSKKALADLMKNRKISLYQGFDPSAPSLHLGNLVGIVKLAQFQKLGHKVIFLIGDFTGRIGDPTDKESARKRLTKKEVENNLKLFKKQAGTILNFEGKNKAEVRYNSEWNEKIRFDDLIEITSNFTVQQMIERDMFQERLKSNKPIYLNEFLYPVAQAIDCVELKVDLEIGGSDQLFNMMAGRSLSKSLLNKEKYVLAMKLITDKQGDKIGKTTGNALFLDSKPEEFFAGIMSLPDESLESCFELLTEEDISEVKSEISNNPMKSKIKLAGIIVEKLWGKEESIKAKEYFKDTFQSDNPHFNLDSLSEGSLAQAILPKTGSTSASKRLIDQGAVEVNGIVSTNYKLKVIKGDNIKIGKKIFVKIN